MIVLLLIAISVLGILLALTEEDKINYQETIKTLDKL